MLAQTPTKQMSKLPTLLHWIDTLNHHGKRPALIAFQKEDVRQVSYEQLADLSNRFAGGLIQRGIGRGDQLALFASGSSNWIAAFLGIIRTGATPVPLDVQFDDDALVHVLNDFQPRWLITDARGAARLAELELETSPDVILLDDNDNDKMEPSWQQLLVDGTNDLPHLLPDDNAIMFYTSGTTGPPKGVPLTHENITTQIDVLLDAELINDDDQVLLPLPLHHVYPLVVGLLTPLARGLPIVFPFSLTGPQMVRALNDMEVTIVIGVPRLYRALYDGIQAKVDSSGWIAKAATRSAMAVSSCIRRRLGVRAGKWLLHPLHQQFGPKLRVVACGGSSGTSTAVIEATGSRVAHLSLKRTHATLTLDAMLTVC